MSIYTYNIIYQITNKVNNKIYIGVHSTNDLNDGYMGSGRYIKEALKKYGKENFSREILYYCETPEEAYAKEEQLVNESFVSRQDTYNINIGGVNGFMSHSDEAKEKIAESKRGIPRPAHVKEIMLKNLSAPRTPESNKKRSETLKGRVFSEEHKNKISDSHKGKSKSESHRKNLSDYMKSLPKQVCPHCDREFYALNYSRWHGDKCKKR